jgi:hypothetical protein
MHEERIPKTFVNMKANNQVVGSDQDGNSRLETHYAENLKRKQVTWKTQV